MTAPAATIEVNGTPRPIPADGTVAALITAELAAAGLESDRGVAVALNRSVVPRSAWAVTRLSAGDQVELLAAAQGG